LPWHWGGSNVLRGRLAVCDVSVKLPQASDGGLLVSELLAVNLTRQRAGRQQVVELLLVLPVNNIFLVGVIRACQHVAKPQVATDVHL
jgi:hypothetical protein